MEKDITGILNIFCCLYNGETAILKAEKNSWSGKAILFDDNFILGLSYGNNKSMPTGVIVGAFVPDTEISIYQLPKNKFNCAPKVFVSVKNQAGEEDCFYGDYSALTPFDAHSLGDTCIEVKTEQKNQSTIDKINQEIEEYKKRVAEFDAYQLSVFNEIYNADINNLTNAIKVLKRINFNKTLECGLKQNENNFSGGKVKNSKKEKRAHHDEFYSIKSGEIFKFLDDEIIF